MDKVYLVVTGNLLFGLVIHSIFSTEERANNYLEALLIKIENESGKSEQIKEEIKESTYVFPCEIDKASPALGYFIYYVVRESDGIYDAIEIPEYLMEIPLSSIGVVEEIIAGKKTGEIVHQVYLRADSRQEALNLGETLISQYLTQKDCIKFSYRIATLE